METMGLQAVFRPHSNLPGLVVMEAVDLVPRQERVLVSEQSSGFQF